MEPSGMTWLRYWGPVCGYAALMFYLSSLSHPEHSLPAFLNGLSDKFLHAMEYAGLGGLCYRASLWGSSERLAPHALLLAISLASLYGLGDELHQSFVPFRDASWLDWVADTVGAGIGAGMMKHLVAFSWSDTTTNPLPGH